MSVSHNFRSALGGFNREDVVHYIEYARAQHDAEIAQLRSENQALKEELAALRAAPAASCTELEERIAALEAERDELKAQLDATAPEEIEPEQLQPQELMVKELEAYRRAERAERNARERAQQIYDQANGVLADAAVQVDEAAARIGQMTDMVSTQLGALQSAVTGSKEALSAAVSVLAAIRPEEQE